MANVLVLYYSSYGHIETMACAVAEGVREAGSQVTIKRVPELVPLEVAHSADYKLDQAAPIASVEEPIAFSSSPLSAPLRRYPSTNAEEAADFTPSSAGR